MRRFVGPFCLLLAAGAASAQSPAGQTPAPPTGDEAKLADLVNAIRNGRPAGTSDKVSSEEAAYFLAGRKKLREFADAHPGDVALKAAVIGATLAIAGGEPDTAVADLEAVLKSVGTATEGDHLAIRLDALRWLVDAKPEYAATVIERPTDDPAPIKQVLAALAADARGRVSQQPGKACTPFTAECIDGRKITSESLKGRVVLILFWSTAFSASLQEVEKWRPLYKNMRARGFEIIGVSLDGKRVRSIPGGGEPLGPGAAAMRKFVDGFGIEWPVVYQGDGTSGAWAQLYRVANIPSTVLIDRDGKFKTIGAPFEETSRAARELVDGK